MPDLKFENAILTRRYDLSDGGHVDIYVWKPEPNSEHPSFDCWYQILGLGNEKPRYGAGIDGVQALSLTLLAISTKLYCSEAYEAGHLTYFGSRDLSLPYFPGEKPGTDEYETAQLLTTAGEPAVVMMPEHRFPYIAYPGERLSNLIAHLDKIREMLDSDEPASKRLQSLSKGIANQQKYYEAVCRRAGHDLAYIPDDWEGA